MSYTAEEIKALVEANRARLAQAHARELVIANFSENTNEISARTTTRAREVYKEVNNKITKHVSREVREEQESAASLPLGSPPEEVGHQVVESISAAAASSSSRVTAITVQHVKTPTGIKLAVAVQTQQDAAQGDYVELTAELKRHGRLRELRRYDPDSYEFQRLYLETIECLKAMTPAEGRHIAMGRLHQRGARGHWFRDMMAVARLNDQDQVTSVILNINGSEFEIQLDQELSPRQQEIYHCTGHYGQLVSLRPAPSLATAARKKFRP